MSVLLATHWWDLQPGHVRTMAAGVAQNPPASVSIDHVHIHT